MARRAVVKMTNDMVDQINQQDIKGAVFLLIDEDGNPTIYCSVESMSMMEALGLLNFASDGVQLMYEGEDDSHGFGH